MDVYHNYCSNLAETIPAVVVSVDYRLAPEHIFPAAYDDCIEALHWIKTSHDHEEWLRDYADLSNCFLMGSSAGDNIAYYVGIRAAGKVKELRTFADQRVGPESTILRWVSEEWIRIEIDERSGFATNCERCDLGFVFDRDYGYCNPTADGGSKELEKIKSLGWKVLINGCDGDPLIHRQIELAKLEGKGVQVMRNFRDIGFHG